MSDSDEPACGSLRHMVPNQRPANSFFANTSFCSAVPCAIKQVGVAAGEQPATADADARLGEEGIGSHLDHARQLHAAVFVVLRRGQHAGLDVGLRRGVRARRQDHLLAVEARLLDIGHAVERRELFARDAFAGVEHRSEWSRASDRRNAAARAAPPRAASRARESRRCRASPDPSAGGRDGHRRRGLHHQRALPAGLGPHGGFGECDRTARLEHLRLAHDFHAGLMRRPRARSCPAPPHRAFRRAPLRTNTSQRHTTWFLPIDTASARAIMRSPMAGRT